MLYDESVKLSVLDMCALYNCMNQFNLLTELCMGFQLWKIRLMKEESSLSVTCTEQLSDKNNFHYSFIVLG